MQRKCQSVKFKNTKQIRNLLKLINTIIISTYNAKNDQVGYLPCEVEHPQVTKWTMEVKGMYWVVEL
jgi:hypothetical protein